MGEGAYALRGLLANLPPLSAVPENLPAPLLPPPAESLSPPFDLRLPINEELPTLRSPQGALFPFSRIVLLPLPFRIPTALAVADFSGS